MPLIVMELPELAAQIKKAVDAAFTEFENKKNQTRVLTAKETAAMLKVSEVSLWKWQKAGRLLPVDRDKAGKGAHRRYRYADVVALMNKCKSKVKNEN